MKLRLIRHATLQIEMHSQFLLIDPMLSEPYVSGSLTFGKSASRNPMVPLPVPMDSLLRPDIIVVTHSHFDHFDSVAEAFLSKHVPLICQPSDQSRFHRAGFSKIIPPDTTPKKVNGIDFSRTSGIHGKGIIGRAMGPVSGYVLQANQEPSVYIAGDTVWGSQVQTVLDKYHPEIIILNAGAAQFNIGKPITMDADDVIEVCRAAPESKIVAVHMEAINHCRLKRRDLAEQLTKANLSNRVIIPADGQSIVW
jgi:L-ascorbate metabolism protein UlaG (beta-lactamase superfamily)